MTAAPAQKPIPPPPDESWLNRMPMVRQTMTVRLPDPKNPGKFGIVNVVEQRKTVRLIVTAPDSSIDRSVDMTLAEARKLSEHLNTICRRIATRPAYRP
jgi:hypothetical protein